MPTNPKCPIAPFKYSDFDPQHGDGQGHKSNLITPDIAAEQANQILEARWLEAVQAAPVLVCSNGGDESKAPRIWWVRALWESIYRKPYTHSARLFCIEKLLPEGWTARELKDSNDADKCL